MNIFLSFSGTSRETFAIKFLDFFNKYGVHCWYDQHELLLGDMLKDTIIEKGLETADYCILIINKTYLKRNWPCEEAKRLYERLESTKDYTIFPILLDITKDELKSSKLHFLLNIKYQFLYTGQSIEQIGLQILNRIFYDQLMKYDIHSVAEALGYFKRLTLSNSIDIYNTLTIVNDFDITNYKDRTIILICLTNLLNKNPYSKTIKRISYYIYDNKNITFDMYKIVESIFLISVSLFKM